MALHLSVSPDVDWQRGVTGEPLHLEVMKAMKVECKLTHGQENEVEVISKGPLLTDD